jgi:hypothetical protein
VTAEHSVSGFLPGTLVGLYDATQEARQAAREAPTAVPIALAIAAESTAVTFTDPPTGVALLAYGTRTDSRPGWVSTRAARALPGDSPIAASENEPDLRPLPPTSEPPRSETAELTPSEPPRSEAPEPEFGRPQPPPTPRKPTWVVGARGADLGRRR